MCEPRTSPAGWLAHEAGPGTAGHVGPGQRQPWEQLVEPNSLRLQESHSCLPLPARGSLWVGAVWNSLYQDDSSQPCPMILESQEQLTRVQTRAQMCGTVDRQESLLLLNTLSHPVTYTHFHTKHTPRLEIYSQAWPHAHLSTNIHGKPSGTLKWVCTLLHTKKPTHTHSLVGPHPYPCTHHIQTPRDAHMLLTHGLTLPRRVSTRIKHLVSTLSGRQIDGTKFTHVFRWPHQHSPTGVSSRLVPSPPGLREVKAGEGSVWGRNVSELPGADSRPGADSLLHSQQVGHHDEKCWPACWDPRSTGTELGKTQLSWSSRC